MPGTLPGSSTLPEALPGTSSGRVMEVVRLFARLGCFAFGGPAAHVAMFDEELVEKRRWIDRQHFLDLMGATQLIPGPNSTEMALHVGFERARWPGMLAAGLGFVGPAAAITLAFAWLYAEYGALPAVEPFLAGILPVVVAIVFVALWRLGKKAMKGPRLGALGLAVAAALLAGIPEVWAMLGGGVTGMFVLRLGQKSSPPSTPRPTDGDQPESAGPDDPPPTRQPQSGRPQSGRPQSGRPQSGRPQSGGTQSGGTQSGGPENGRPRSTAALALPWIGLAAPTATAGSASVLWPLALFFLKVGAVLYGSGYVLVAFLEADVVGRFGWLDQGELLTAIAVGQLTPGPVLTTATFVGFLVAGVPGAVVATLAIFLPSFCFVALLNPWVPRLRRSAWSAAFLDAVNASAVALMAVVTARLCLASVTDPATALLLAGALVASLRYQVGPPWLILGGAVVGGLFLG